MLSKARRSSIPGTRGSLSALPEPPRKENELIDVSQPLRDEAARISKAPEERLRLDQFCRDARGGEALIALTVDSAVPADALAEIAEAIHDAYRRGKSHAMVVVAEGAKYNAEALVRHFKTQSTGFELRATILGHVQRGGVPTAYDRLLATRLGAGAVDALDKGISGVVVGMNQGVVSTTPYAEIVGRTKGISPDLYQLAHVLSR